MTERLGRYEILEEIGQGGFAYVYRARDTELDRLIALKELKPILLQDTNWVKRFRREAKAIARLDHSRILTIHDVGQTEGRLFIVMRLVNGPSLEKLISTQGQLSWPQALEITAAMAEGLDYAHAQGILHRDLKPANILIDPERGPLLSDFGLAKLAGDNSMSVSATGSVVGTPHYIAPEVWEGQEATPQVDIYALGCVLYEMLTGEKVFKGETPPAVMMAHFKPLSLPKEWPDDVPPGVTDVLKTALANKPANRYRSAGAMAKALANLSTTGPEAVADRQEELPTGERDVAQPAELPISPSEAAGTTPADEQLEGAEESAAEAAVYAPLASPATSPASQAAPAQPQQKRIGCFWRGVAIGGGLLLLLVIGVGGVCSTTQGIFNAAMPTVEVGDTITEEIKVPILDPSEPVNLELDFETGRLTLAPGAREELVEGTVTYNVAKLKPQIITSGRQVRLHSQDSIGLAAFSNQNIQNHWDLQLSAVPMALTIKAKGMEGDLELGGLSLTELKVEQGAANFDLAFSASNQVEMEQLEFSGGAANVALTGLANTRAREILLTVGAGSYILDFSGQLQTDIDLKLEAGLSTVTIIVPAGTATTASVSEGDLANINARDAWQQQDQKYILPGEGFEIRMDIEMGPGNLEFRNP